MSVGLGSPVADGHRRTIDRLVPRWRSAGVRAAPAAQAGSDSTERVTLTATLDELGNREADVSRDATQQDGRQIPTTVDRNGRAAPVGVAELLVGTALAHLFEAECDEDGDNLARLEDGNGRHAIRLRR